MRIRARAPFRDRGKRGARLQLRSCAPNPPMILSPFNRAKASYSENKVSAPVPGASSLKNKKLACSASLDRSLRPRERSSSSSRLMRARQLQNSRESQPVTHLILRLLVPKDCCLQNQHSKHRNRIERLPAGTTLPHLLRC